MAPRKLKGAGGLNGLTHLAGVTTAAAALFEIIHAKLAAAEHGQLPLDHRFTLPATIMVMAGCFDRFW